MAGEIAPVTFNGGGTARAESEEATNAWLLYAKRC
jgi:hypothetical protein